MENWRWMNKEHKDLDMFRLSVWDNTLFLCIVVSNAAVWLNDLPWMGDTPFYSQSMCGWLQKAYPAAS